MNSRKTGNLNPKIMNELAPGLNYIAMKGTDLTLNPSLTRKEKVVLKEHSFFDAHGKLLPQPYKVGEFLIPRYLMDLYHILTEVDLARYVRIISIIISEFTGPKEQDYFKNHLNRLRVMLKKELTTPDREKAMMIALLAYEQYTGDRAYFKTILEEKDYYTFIRALNSLYNLYTVHKKRHPAIREAAIEYFKDLDEKKLLEIMDNSEERAHAFKLLKDNHMITPRIKSEDTLFHLMNLPTKREEFIDVVKDWIKDPMIGMAKRSKQILLISYINLTDERLIAKLKDKRQREILFNFLQRNNIYKVKSEGELHSYINKDKERQDLLNILLDYCEKECIIDYLF
ncbi:MAG: hypothetical protein P8Y23_02425 [Candidatus Lokiarchaeota archaeon]